MKFPRISALFAVAAALCPATAFAGIEVSFEDVESFTDFTVHGLFRQKEAKVLFERQIQTYWKRRLHEVVPEGTSVKLHFNDIDMAGDMLPWSQGPQSHLRIIKDMYPPRLDFNYTITSEDGEILAEGTKNQLGKDFSFRLRRKPTAEDITFFYEFEMLYLWLDSLDLTGSPGGGKTD